MSGTATGALVGAATTTVLATVEATTGISVPMFVWGAVGGLWAFWYLEPMTLCHRMFSLLIAALVAGTGAKTVAMIIAASAAHYFTWWPKGVDANLVAVPVAMTIGLLCHTVIGKKIIEIAQRGADRIAP